MYTLLHNLLSPSRGAGAGPAGPADAGPMFTPKSRNKRARSWMAAAAKAVNAHAAVASSTYIALDYCEVKVAIAKGPGIPPNRIRSVIRRPEIQKFPGGGGQCPQIPLAYALRARVCSPCTVLASHSPAGPVRMSFRRPCIQGEQKALSSCEQCTLGLRRSLLQDASTCIDGTKPQAKLSLSMWQNCRS